MPSSAFARQDEQLLACCFSGNVAEVERLVMEEDVGVNTKNPMGLTPMHMAVMSGQTRVVAFLLHRSAEIDAKDDEGRTPLHTTCIEGDEETCALLLAKKANVHARTNNGSTPLHLASWHDEKDIVGWLLEAGADVRAMNEQGQSVLDDPELDPEIGILLQAHAAENHVSVAHLTMQPATMTSSGCSDKQGAAARPGDKVLVARPYRPAGEPDLPSIEESSQEEPVSIDSKGVLWGEAGAPVYVADAVGATAQVGEGMPGEPAGPAQGGSFRGGMGGISASHPLMQPLEECDIFGNPIGNAAEVAADLTNGELKGGISDDAMARIMAQLGDNMF